MLAHVDVPVGPVPCRTLADYIAGLVTTLGEHEPASLMRLRAVVGARRARIALDAEAVIVHFAKARLVIEPDVASTVVDGSGETDRLTTLALLDGTLEVTDAIVGGQLQATGDVEALVRIFQAIEILLDASTRVPALQLLSADYIGDPCRVGPPPRFARVAPPRSESEAEMLARLDLLP